MGDLFDPCTSDFDCKGLLLCYSNVTWGPTAEPFCSCHSFYGWGGSDCQTFTSMTYLLMANISIQIVCAGFISIWMGYDLFRIGKHFGKHSRNATVSTVVTLVLGSICMFIWKILYLLNLLTPDGPPQGDPLSDFGEKKSTYNNANAVFIFLTELFFVLCGFELSVAWVKIAEASKNFSSSVHFVGVEKYRKFVYVCEAIFSIFMIGIASQNAYEFSVIAAAPFMATLSGFFYVGRKKMIKLLAGAVEYSAGSSNEGYSSSQVQNLKAAMYAINKTAFHAILSIWLLLGLGVVHLLFRGTMIFKAGWKETAPYEGFAVTPFINDILGYCVVYFYLNLSLYSHGMVKNILTQNRKNSISVNKSTFKNTSGTDKQEYSVASYNPNL